MLLILVQIIYIRQLSDSTLSVSIALFILNLDPNKFFFSTPPFLYLPPVAGFVIFYTLKQKNPQFTVCNYVSYLITASVFDRGATVEGTDRPRPRSLHSS